MAEILAATLYAALIIACFAIMGLTLIAWGVGMIVLRFWRREWNVVEGG